MQRSAGQGPATAQPSRVPNVGVAREPAAPWTGAWLGDDAADPAAAICETTMTESRVIAMIREHVEGLFPKVCSCCQHRFPTFSDYLLNTRPVGSVISYDAEAGDWQPLNPLGTFTFANCRCGNTLSLTNCGTPLARLWSVLRWVKAETARRGTTPQELLNGLRDEISRQVLALPNDRAGASGAGSCHHGVHGGSS